PPLAKPKGHRPSSVPAAKRAGRDAAFPALPAPWVLSCVPVRPAPTAQLLHPPERRYPRRSRAKRTVDRVLRASNNSKSLLSQKGPAMLLLRDLQAPGRQSRPWLDRYPAGVSANLDYPEQPLGWLLEQGAARYPQRVACRYYSQQLTYEELLTRA